MVHMIILLVMNIKPQQTIATSNCGFILTDDLHYAKNSFIIKSVFVKRPHQAYVQYTTLQ